MEKQMQTIGECSNMYEYYSLCMTRALLVQRSFAGECARLTGNTSMAVCVIFVSFLTVKSRFAEAHPIVFLSARSYFHQVFILCFHPNMQRHRASVTIILCNHTNILQFFYQYEKLSIRSVLFTLRLTQVRDNPHRKCHSAVLFPCKDESQTDTFGRCARA